MVTELNKTVAFEMEIIQKTKEEKLTDSSLPKFPAGAIDGKLIFEDRTITTEELITFFSTNNTNPL